jgi:hypothetical protein
MTGQAVATSDIGSLHRGQKGSKLLAHIHFGLFTRTAGLRVQLLFDLADHVGLQFSITTESCVVVIPHSLILKEPEIQAITDFSELDQTLVHLLDDFLENFHPVLLLAITTKP